MKKIFIISIIFVTSLLFLAGCGDSPASGRTGRADTSPLFPESEATIPMNSIDLSNLSDGTWEFKMVYVTTYNTPNGTSIYLPGGGSVGCNVNSWTWVDSFTFTKSGSTLTVTSGTNTKVYTMDDANKVMVNSYAANHGASLTWNGNTLTISANETSTYMVTAAFEDSARTYFTTKKNTAGTRFIVKSNSSTTSKPNIHYLKKLN